MSAAKGKSALEIKSRLKSLWAESTPPTYNRILVCACVALSFSFMYVFWGPIEVIAYGGDSFVYSVKDALPYLALTALAIFLAAAFLLRALCGKVRDISLSVIFSLTLGGYIQAAFLNTGIGSLDGEAVSWNLHKGEFYRDFAVWLVIFATVFFARYINKKLWVRLISGASALLVVMQAASFAAVLFTLGAKPAEEDLASYSLTADGMYEFSKKDNILIFVLDRLDYDYIKEVEAERPDFFKSLDGFTSYTDAVSAFARTRPALAQLVTGYEETAYKTSAEKYYDDAWDYNNGGILSALAEKSYTAEFYTSIKYLFGSAKYLDSVSNVRFDPRKKIIYPNFISKMSTLSIYRYAPTAVKPFFWSDSNYYNDGVLAKNDGAYVFDDARYAAAFSDSTAQRESGCFKLYHFNGSHTPYTLREDMTKSEGETSVTEQTMGCFNILYSIFLRMKELGIYKDATIIITGDHGEPLDDYIPLAKATRIGLFYKPSGSEGTPLTESASPVCTDNIPPTVLKALGAEYANYGAALDEVKEGDSVVRYYYKSVASKSTNREAKVYKYRINRDASSFGNWDVADVYDIRRGNSFN